ncbi:MAG: SAM-dependent methyltransferase [Acidimicrobiia bacterium]|nr:SAM-dependent methyltransferase [Acidimicrobiia bacterium]
MNLERSADGEYRFLRFDRFMAEALYGVGGFFQSGGQAGGSDGDFLTSPETGALFGRLWGRALDRFWEELGRPDPFVVIEAGAGAGTLARSVLRSQPECGSALALHLVEASQSLAALDQARARLDQFPNVVVHRSIATSLSTCKRRERLEPAPPTITGLPTIIRPMITGRR